LSYDFKDGNQARYRSLTNYFLAARKGNPLFAKCQKLFLEVWKECGGRLGTERMHASPLLKGLGLIGAGDDMSFEEDGRKFDAEEVRRMLTDYIAQGQVMSMVLGTVDAEDRWDGPGYVQEHVYAIEFMVGAQVINQFTDWDGRRAFELMSLQIPCAEEIESVDQAKARKIVETCLQKSFGFKLAHRLILRVKGDTLGSLWRKNDGSDHVPGTYAHWLRYRMVYWTQDELPSNLQMELFEPVKRGPLFRAP